MTDIATYKLDAAYADLSWFDHCATADHFMEISLWHNGEGFDVHLNSYDKQSFRLTWGEFKALKKLVKTLDK